MSQKSRLRCITISQEELRRQLQTESCNELDIEILKNGATDSKHGGFVYLKIIGVYRNDMIGWLSFSSFTFHCLRFDDNNEKPDSTGILYLEKGSCGKVANKLDRGMTIVARGFRLASAAESFSEDLISLILDDNCPNGIIYIVDSKRGTSENVACVPKQKDAITEPEYESTALTNIGNKVTSRVNVYGVVQWFSYGDKGALKMRLIDQSIAKDQLVTCSLMMDPANTTFQLPDIRQVGDIVRLHRVAVQQTADGYALFGRMGVFGLSGLVWDGEQGENLQPRMSSSTHYTVKEQDYDKIRSLRQWIRDEHLAVPQARNADNTPSDLVTVSRYPRGKYRSIVGRVIAVWNQSPDCALIRLTDGTKPHSAVFKQIIDDEQRLKCLCIDADMDRAVGDCKADVFVYDQYKQQAVKMKPGDFLLMKNVHLALIKDQRAALAFTVHGGRKGQFFGRGLFPLDSTNTMANNVKKSVDSLVQNAPTCLTAGADRSPTAAPPPHQTVAPGPSANQPGDESEDELSQCPPDSYSTV